MAERPAGNAPAPRATRSAYCFAAGGPADFAIYDRTTLMAGDSLPGPAVIEEATTTVVYFSDQTAAIDVFGQIVITPQTKTAEAGS